MARSNAAVTALPAGIDTDVEELRDRFLAHLSDALDSLEAAAADLAQLRAEHGGDPRFAPSTVAGDDVEAFLGKAARPVRAGYALASAAIEGQLPRRRGSKPTVVR
jgi:hypothetical protein